MRIGIDARMYGPKQGGLGRYIQQLIKHLENLPEKNEYVIFLRQENWGEYTPANPCFTKVLADIPWYGWREQIKFSPIIKKQKIDLMHFPHWNIPVFYRHPFVVTIHDLLLMHHSTARTSTLGPILYWFKNKAYRFVIKQAAKRARHIITTSEFTKNDIHETIGISKEKITVTYQAPTSLPTTITSLPAGIQKPYVLYVGVAYPHKNLEGLLNIWTHFKKTYQTNHQLVLVGKENYFYKRLITSPAWQKTPNVHYTGFIPDENLATLYQNASLYVMPSLYEGYALPSLEAMTFDLPIVSSNTTCLPEILGSAALYADPQDISGFADALYQGLTDQQTRNLIVAAAPKVLNRYSSQKLAEQTNATYHHNGG